MAQVATAALQTQAVRLVLALVPSALVEADTSERAAHTPEADTTLVALAEVGTASPQAEGAAWHPLGAAPAEERPFEQSW